MIIYVYICERLSFLLYYYGGKVINHLFPRNFQRDFTWVGFWGKKKSEKGMKLNELLGSTVVQKTLTRTDYVQ